MTYYWQKIDNKIFIIPFTVVGGIEYLGIKPRKDIKYLYTKNYKTLLY